MGTTSAFEYRPPADEREQAELAQIVDQSFAGFGRSPGAAQRWFAWLGRERLRVGVRDGRVVAGLGLLGFEQWFGGRLVASTGVSCVAVAPEARGGGAGGALIQAMVRELAQSGVAIVSLYPSTLPLYRRAGFELAGSQTSYEIDFARIGCRVSDPPLIRLGVQDAPRLRAAHGRVAATRNGEVQRSLRRWERQLTLPDETLYIYGVPSAADPDVLDAFVTYVQVGRPAERYEIELRDLVIANAAAGRRLLSFLGDHFSVSRLIRFEGLPAEPIAALTRDGGVSAKATRLWMLRVNDVRRALTQRGYPACVRGELVLDVDDPLIDSNRGSFLLRVQKGAAQVEAGASTASPGARVLRIHIRGLAPLFTGYSSAEELAVCGLAQADADTLALATGLFAGRPPGMTERF